VGYVGFFTSGRHTWRLWNSMAFRVWEGDGLGQVMFDWMSAHRRARGAERAVLLKPDGPVHTWSFRYDPEARADLVWHDKALERQTKAWSSTPSGTASIAGGSDWDTGRASGVPTARFSLSSLARGAAARVQCGGGPGLAVGRASGS
jgi:hypothetical protein